MNSNQTEVESVPRRKLTMRQTLTACVTLIALACGVIAMGALGGDESDDSVSNEARALPVEAISVRQITSFEQERTYTGVIRAQRESEMSFERVDQLVELNFDVGDRVSAGEVLATIDHRSLTALRNEKLAQIAKESAILAELVAGPRTEVIASQAALVDDLEAQVSLTKLQQKRFKGLHQSTAVSTREYESTEFGLESIIARTESAKHQLKELQAGTRIEKITAQEAIIKQFQSSLENIDVQIGDSQLVAPYAAVITKRFVDEGITTAPSQSIYRIVDDQMLEAWIGVPPTISERLSVGDQLDIAVRGKTIPSKIRSIVAELDQTTRTQTVILEFENQDQIVPGEIVRVVVNEVAEIDGFLVPTSALVRAERGLWSAFVVDAADGQPTSQSKTRRAIVEVIKNDAHRAVVRGTLKEGDRVVANGLHRLVEGQNVMVLDTQPTTHGKEQPKN